MRAGGRCLVLQDDVQSMDDAGNVSEEGQQDVDEQVGTAATLKEDTKRWEDNGDDDFADVGSGERHIDGCEI